MRTPVSHGNVDRLVAVAIDNDKSSHIALKWAIDNVVAKGQALTLIHVKLKQSLPGLNQISDATASIEVGDDIKVKELFLPFRMFCTHKGIHQCYDVIDDTDVTRAITEFVKQSTINILVLGATSKGNSIFRFKTEDNIPGSVMKRVPDFCSVYVINKGKVSSSRAASSPPPSFPDPLILARGGKMSSVFPFSNNSRSLFTGQSRPGSDPSLLAKQNEANFIKYVIYSLRTSAKVVFPCMHLKLMFNNGNILSCVLFMICALLRSLLEQQQRMDMELKESMEKLEQEWRQTMEKLERERLAMEQAWEDREEERRLREEKRDALLTALLNKR